MTLREIMEGYAQGTYAPNQKVEVLATYWTSAQFTTIEKILLMRSLRFPSINYSEVDEKNTIQVTFETAVLKSVQGFGMLKINFSGYCPYRYDISLVCEDDSSLRSWAEIHGAYFKAMIGCDSIKFDRVLKMLATSLDSIKFDLFLSRDKSEVENENEDNPLFPGFNMSFRNHVEIINRDSSKELMFTIKHWFIETQPEYLHQYRHPFA